MNLWQPERRSPKQIEERIHVQGNMKALIVMSENKLLPIPYHLLTSREERGVSLRTHTKCNTLPTSYYLYRPSNHLLVSKGRKSMNKIMSATNYFCRNLGEMMWAMKYRYRSGVSHVTTHYSVFTFLQAVTLKQGFIFVACFFFLSITSFAFLWTFLTKRFVNRKSCVSGAVGTLTEGLRYTIVSQIFVIGRVWFCHQTGLILCKISTTHLSCSHVHFWVIRLYFIWKFPLDSLFYLLFYNIPTHKLSRL